MLLSFSRMKCFYWDIKIAMKRCDMVDNVLESSTDCKHERNSEPCPDVAHARVTVTTEPQQ